jgi:hypothetical protein
VKRARRRTNENTLSAYWSPRENDFVFRHPPGVQTRASAHLLHVVLNTDRPRVDCSGDGRQIVWDPSLVKELDRRGYDVKTLRFSIMKKEKTLFDEKFDALELRDVTLGEVRTGNHASRPRAPDPGVRPVLGRPRTLKEKP